METRTDTPDPPGPEPAASRSRGAALGVLAVAGLVAFGSARDAGAQSIGELEGRIASAGGQASGLAASIDAGNARLAVARSRASSAAAEEAELASVLAAGEEREDELSAEVAVAERRLTQARARLGRAQEALSGRLVAIYKGETIDEVQLLLSADGYDDLATRMQLLKRIQRADEELAVRVRELEEAVERHLSSVEAARAEQRAQNDEVAAARDQIAAARAAAEAQAARIAALRDQQAAALSGLRSQISGWSDEVRDARAARAAAAVQPTGTDGSWSIPSYIVMCESGGSYGAVNPSSGAGGAYQILPSTWALYGGEGLPQNASRAEQDRIAALIWADSGGSAWVCAG